MQIAVELLERKHAAKGSPAAADPAIDAEEPYFTDLAEDVHQMSELIQDLLFYSRTRNAPVTIPAEGVALAPLVKEVIDREGMHSKGVITNVASNIFVQVSATHLRRAIANLLRNAQQYGGEAGHVEVAAAIGGGRAHLFVRDQGPGIPEEELEQVFAPFYRVEFARSRRTGGTGLGLAIVKSSIEACGGTVCCRNLHPNGLEVEMTLSLSTVVSQPMLELQSTA